MKSMQLRLSISIFFLICIVSSFFLFKNLSVVYAKKPDHSVVIQNLDQTDRSVDKNQVLVTHVEEEQPVILSDDNTSDDTDKSVMSKDYHVSFQSDMEQEDISFVTMPITVDYKIDVETYYALDRLIGNDLYRSINLFLQSSNNVLSKESCKSCNVHMLCKKVKRRTDLTPQDIKLLQHLVGNLYRFVQATKNMSGSLIVSSDQYDALQFLNQATTVNNRIQAYARKVAAADALKKLESMSCR